MNEKQFAKHIHSSVLEDRYLRTWYDSFLYDREFKDTVKVLSLAIKTKALTNEQAVILSLFIGITTYEGLTKE